MRLIFLQNIIATGEKCVFLSLHLQKSARQKLDSRTITTVHAMSEHRILELPLYIFMFYKNLRL